MAHTHSKLIYHCIFSTKKRRPLLRESVLPRLCDYLGGVLRNHDGHLLSSGGTEDHVHLLVELNAATPIAEAMRVVKAVSSKWLHETYPELRDFGWQTGYAAFSVSMSGVEEVIRYVSNQKDHHRNRTFDEEYIAFLRRHGVAYDERFVLD